MQQWADFDADNGRRARLLLVLLGGLQLFVIGARPSPSVPPSLREHPQSVAITGSRAGVDLLGPHAETTPRARHAR
jgi:hypothetical protein